MNRKERREKAKEINLLEEVVTIIRQYFPELLARFDGLTDVRNQSYVKYQMKVIFMVRLMALMCEIKSMNEISRDFNTEETIQNIAQICGLELDEIPHHDTINNVFETVQVPELEQIIKYIITRLMRSKMLGKKTKSGVRYFCKCCGKSISENKINNIISKYCAWGGFSIDRKVLFLKNNISKIYIDKSINIHFISTK